MKRNASASGQTIADRFAGAGPGGWFYPVPQRNGRWVLAAGGLLLPGVLAWCILGTITLSLWGKGVVLYGEGIAAVETAGGGLVMEVGVKAGDAVAAGQVLGRLDDPGVRQQLEQLEAECRAAQEKQERMEELNRQTLRRDAEAFARSRENLQKRAQNLQDHRKFLEERVEGLKRLKTGGIAREDEVLAVRARLDEVGNDLVANDAALLALEERQISREAAIGRERVQAAAAVAAVLARLTPLRHLFTARTEVRATRAGRILALDAEPGAVLQPGAVFAVIGGEDAAGLTAAAFFPADTAKRLRPGMTAELLPAGGEPGGWRAEVTAVSADLSPAEGAGTVLRRRALAQKTLEQHGTIVMAQLRLLRDGQGRLVRTDGRPAGQEAGGWRPGTPCEVRVILEQRRPAEVILPRLREFFGKD